MAHARGEGPITLSLLDRLVDMEPRQSLEGQMTRSQSLTRFREGVRRDIEWLLNTRVVPDEVPIGEQVKNSLHTYGLPDIATISATSAQDQLALTQKIEDSIRKFEPRILNVRVKLVTAGDEKSGSLRFVIEGLLRVDPAPEAVSFDTTLDLSNREYRMSGDAGAR
jgi:type VI secretion system protein ImpF